MRHEKKPNYFKLGGNEHQPPYGFVNRVRALLCFFDEVCVPLGCFPAGCQEGTRCFLPLPIKSARPMLFNASRKIGQFSGAWYRRNALCKRRCRAPRTDPTFSESRVTFRNGFFSVWYIAEAMAKGVGRKAWTWSRRKLFAFSHSASCSMSSSVVPGWAEMK